ncbi:MAG: redoxin domain-containing protein [Ignavibacteria bacterium]|nr:redoxin domain-containing protein [Ignavibacteria bacterium]
MKNREVCSVLFLIALIGSCVFAQDQVASMSPGKPKVGDNIVITYNALSKTAQLRDMKNISAEIMVMKENEPPLRLEVPMRRSGLMWKGSFKLLERKARLLLVRFASGEVRDDNGENAWNYMVYGVDNQPLMGVHLQRSTVLGMGGYMDFKVQRDIEAAKVELSSEKALYPGNLDATFVGWGMMMRQRPGAETLDKVHAEMDKMYEANKGNEEIVEKLISGYDETGLQKRADKIRKEAIAANPKGKVAQSIRTKEIFAEKDPAKQLELLERFLRDFPQDSAGQQRYVWFHFNLLVSTKQYDKAATFLEAMPNKNGHAYNALAWPLIQKGEQLEKAIGWAKKGIDMVKNPESSKMPAYYPKAQWKKENDINLGKILSTYGFGLFQLGKKGKAEVALEEATKLTNGDFAGINLMLVDCYIKNAKYSKAMETAANCIRKGKSNEKILEAYKTAYVKVKGSDRGFEIAVARAKNAVKEDLKRELLRTRVNKPTVDFALKNLEGKLVKLSDLRGKVVVVDFWATWCGPCKASFPYLQQVCNKYKDNPKVVIFAVNTWENISGKEKEDLVKKFMADNKYTFSVLYDEGFVDKYGVEGIPTKFVIDKMGMIQFKTKGFTGDRMVDELTMQLEILLDDNFYSSPK